jgi:hypothetical protein
MNLLQNITFLGRGQRILGTNDVSSLVVESCRFESCRFGYNSTVLSDKRDVVRDCVFTNCRISKCLVGPAIIRSTRINDLENDMLICWGALFDQVTLSGKIGPVMLHGIPSSTASPVLRESHKAFAEHFYANVDFALDISNALFSDFSIRTDAVPLSLVRRDPNCQFIISRPIQPRRPDWIDSLAVSRFTKIAFTLMNDDCVNEGLLVAPKLDLGLYEQVLRDADVLAKEGLLKA